MDTGWFSFIISFEAVFATLLIIFEASAVTKEQSLHLQLLEKLSLSRNFHTRLSYATNSSFSKEVEDKNEEDEENLGEIFDQISHEIEEFDVIPTLWFVPISQTTWRNLSTSLVSGVVIILITLGQLIFESANLVG